MKKSKPVVEESTVYDSYVGKSETLEVGVLPIELDIDDEKEAQKYWRGMPEFEQKDNPSYKTIYLHFRNKEDFDEFCSIYHKLVDTEQKISFKTKSMWYPHLDREANSLLRWVEKE